MFASPAPFVKRSLARGSTTAQNALNNSLMRTNSHVRTKCFHTDQVDSELTIFCPLQAPAPCSVAMSRSTSRTGGSSQCYATTTTTNGSSSHPMQRATSSTMADVRSATHLSPSMSSYGVRASSSPSRGFPFPMSTHCSLPMSRGPSGSQYGLEEVFEDLNIVHETTHYTVPFSLFDVPIPRGRYTRAQTPIAPPLSLSMSRRFPVLSDASPIPPPSPETTASAPASVRPQRLQSILKNSSMGHPPSPVPGSTPIISGAIPVLTAPSVSKRTTFSNETTEIENSMFAREDSAIGYRSCRGRPPTPLPEMLESEGEASD